MADNSDRADGWTMAPSAGNSPTLDDSLTVTTEDSFTNVQGPHCHDTQLINSLAAVSVGGEVQAGEDLEHSSAHIESRITYLSVKSPVAPGLSLKKDPVQVWYSTGEKMTISFPDHKHTLQFPTAALVASFGYFKRMLNSPIPYREVNEGLVEFDEIDYYEFSVLITWLVTGGLKMPVDKHAVVETCIAAVVAADYLQMDNIDEFITLMDSLLSKHLCNNRRSLLGTHLDLLHENAELFDNQGKPIRLAIAAAGVRPFLTSEFDRGQSEGPAQKGKALTGKVQSGKAGGNTAATHRVAVMNVTWTDWNMTVKHYDGLMRSHPWYAVDVMAGVSDTIRKGSRNPVTLATAIHNTEGKEIKAVDHSTYLDPLFKWRWENGMCSSFTI